MIERSRCTTIGMTILPTVVPVVAVPIASTLLLAKYVLSTLNVLTE